MSTIVHEAAAVEAAATEPDALDQRVSAAIYEAHRLPASPRWAAISEAVKAWIERQALAAAIEVVEFLGERTTIRPSLAMMVMVD